MGRTYPSAAHPLSYSQPSLSLAATRTLLACRRRELPAALKPAALTVLSNVLLSLPAHAEAGKIFDFNLTLPIMAGQFLLLMVFLDKAWFGPVGKLLDERDAELRGKLSLVKDNSSQIAALQVSLAVVGAKSGTGANGQDM